MKGFASTTILGNVTRDPELRYTPKGAAVAQFAVAVNESWTGEDGQKHERVTFLECDAWNGAAETLARYVRKGDPIFVTAALRMEEWEDKQTGQKRQKLKFRVEQFRLLGGNRDGDGQGDAPRQRPQRPAGTRRQTTAADDGGPPPEDDDVPF